MMDVESQAMPASQEAAPADAPRDGIARGTEGSPDENRPATVAGSPAAAPPPAKRARTAATEGVKSFDGAKQFIAQLREAERAPPAEPPAEPRARHPEPETRFAETAAPRTGGAVAEDDATRGDVFGVAGAAPVSRATPPETRRTETNEETEMNKQTETSPPNAVNGALDAFEEDAVHVLSGLFEEDLSQALSDAGTRDPKRKRRSSVSVANAKAGVFSAKGGGRFFSGESLDGEAHYSERRATTTSDVARANLNGGVVSAVPSGGPSGPSSSRKAADHRRLLKSYMKALFRHLRLPVDIKPADAATYRDRINSALGFWFGETFSPGRTVVECNAPKVVAALFYLATFGAVQPTVEDVARVLKKGPQAKNANYAVDEGELLRLGVSVAQLKALFEGPSRVERGFPRGVPLALPDLDALPAPAPPPKLSFAEEDAPKDAPARRDAQRAPAKKKTQSEKPEKRDEGVLSPDPRVSPSPAAVGEGPGSLNPDPGPGPAEGAGESGGGAAERKTRARTPRGRERRPSNDGSPLFSPVGGVTAAFAAAALMPSAGDRSSAVRAFLETHVAPALAALDAHPVETQLEMLNCAQGAFVARAASLAKAQHRASLRAAREDADENREKDAEEEARPPPADAVPRGKRGRGGKRA